MSTRNNETTLSSVRFVKTAFRADGRRTICGILRNSIFGVSSKNFSRPPELGAVHSRWSSLTMLRVVSECFDLEVKTSINVNKLENCDLVETPWCLRINNERNGSSGVGMFEKEGSYSL